MVRLRRLKILKGLHTPVLGAALFCAVTSLLADEQTVVQQEAVAGIAGVPAPAVVLTAYSVYIKEEM